MKNLRNLLIRLQHYYLPIVSGLLIGFSYIPLPGVFVLICYAPLWYWCLRESNTRRLFAGGWISQFILSLIGFHWIAYTAYEFGQFPIWFSLIVLLAFAAFIHLYIPLTLVVFNWLRRRWQFSPHQQLLLLPLLFSVSERFWPSLFQWHLGYTLFWNEWPVYQLADLVGFEGLSTWIFFANAFVVYLAGLPNWKLRTSRAMAGLFVFGLLNLAGYLYRPKNVESTFLKALVVQANIGNADKIMAERGKGGYQAAIVDQFLELTRQGLQQYPDTEMVFWPETAYPDLLDGYRLQYPQQQRLLNFLERYQVTLFTGAYSADPPGQPERKSYNSVFIVPAAPGQKNSYNKTHLLMFGEFIPLSETFPIIEKWLPYLANFGRGDGPTTLPYFGRDVDDITKFSLDPSLHNQEVTVPIQIGPQICYEGLYPHFTRKLAAQGANVLVNVTNDSWFSFYPWLWPAFEPEQHLYMTMARAIETRLPLIRTTNTGVSSVVLPDGSLMQRSPLREPWFGFYNVPVNLQPTPTLYTRWGGWDLLVWFLLVLFFCRKTTFRGQSQKASPL